MCVCVHVCVCVCVINYLSHLNITLCLYVVIFVHLYGYAYIRSRQNFQHSRLMKLIQVKYSAKKMLEVKKVKRECLPHAFLRTLCYFVSLLLRTD